MKRVAFLLPAVLCACPSPSRTTTVGNTTDTTGAPAARKLTPDGLGALSATTPITVEAVQPLFPDLEVTTDKVEREDGEHVFLRAARKGAPTPEFLIYFADQKLYSVEVWTPDIPTSGGAAVGQTFADAAAALGGVECFGAVEEEGGNAYCWSTATKSLAIVVPLNDETSKYYDKDVPAADHATAFANQKVEKLVWGPGRE